MVLGAKKVVGNVGESIAAKFLETRGFTVLARNHREKWGEIDIIAEKDGVVHFVEVKTVSRENITDVSREMNNYRPEEMVHPGKLRKIARTAETYMNATNDRRDFQIDVVGVLLDARRKVATCRLFEQVL
jgi:putative endonuclease